MAEESQLAPAVLMVRPAAFFSNPETIATNRFQQGSKLLRDDLQQRALGEFDMLATALEEAGVRVLVENDSPQPVKPDAIFPNNWISTHADGTVVLYPMEAVSRRAERRMDIVDALGSRYGYQVREVLDLSAHESEGRFLEGTGSLVLDRVNHIAYACRSSRTSEVVLREWAGRLRYETVLFDAVDRHGIPIYHTNVMMSIGEGIAVVCADSIPRDNQRNRILQSLRTNGHDVIHLTLEQMERFIGNMLQLGSRNGPVMAMSEAAEEALASEQRRRLESGSRIVSTGIATIESCSGGSVRCMLAEIHLPG